MDTDDAAQYFAVDTRLESFQTSKSTAKRKSTTSKGKASKAVAWPHKSVDPVDLARAGFYFDPIPEQPDNVVCFLCKKRMCGWEDGDNPFLEHIRLSPGCGWAIVSAIEVGLGDMVNDDPASPEMVEARRATFADMWPHENKKGWKCKTKQLVDAGWKYTPAPGYEDMATCTYCSLALDGWEPKDNPLNEHYKRSPDCRFFTLTNQYQQAAAPPKKAARGKGTRGSKASRLSTQSNTTAADVTASVIDATAEVEDSVMTTTSVATQGGTKKPRAKKATTAKGKKTKAKKEEPEPQPEPVEVPEDISEAPDASTLVKPAKSRKRASDQVDDSTLVNAEAPAPKKKRATRGRSSKATNDSVIAPEPDVEMTDEDTAPAPKKKARASKAKTSRKASTASTASTSSQSSIPAQRESSHLMDDAEIERQLEADLDRPLTDDENLDADSDSERRRASTPKPKKKQPTVKKNSTASRKVSVDHHAMFDPSPVEVDEDDIEAELRTMQTDAQSVDLEAEEPKPLPAPAKSRKTGTRKVSKQSKKAPSPPPIPSEPEHVSEMDDVRYDDDIDELAEGHEESIVSNATVTSKPASAITSSTAPAAGPKKRAPTSKKSVASRVSAETVSKSKAVSQKSQSSDVDDLPEPPKTKRSTVVQKKAVAAKEKSQPPPPAPAEDELSQTPATPPGRKGPTAWAKQATMSPSQSPQSSDAENQPPSSKPSGTAESKRIALVPVAVTPNRMSPSKMSPSKRHLMSGLQSEKPWCAADVEAIFEDLEKENENGTSNLLQGGPDLTSPEKRMTVEEWIYFNASQAEQKLKYECEAVVSAFEREGARAMQTLEGLVVE